MDMNFNYAQCLKSADHWGYTIHKNVCTGAEYTLQWGFFDWAGTILLVLLSLGLTGILFAFILFIFAVAKEALQ